MGGQLGVIRRPGQPQAGADRVIYGSDHPDTTAAACLAHARSMLSKHEFTDDGNVVGVARWGKAWEDASLYDQQAGLHCLVYEPALIGTIQNDLVGIGANWVDPSAAGARDEYNVEVFYRFPLFPGVDTTLSYQSVFDPALNTEFDHAHVFSLRLRSVF